MDYFDNSYFASDYFADGYFGPGEGIPSSPEEDRACTPVFVSTNRLYSENPEIEDLVLLLEV